MIKVHKRKETLYLIRHSFAGARAPWAMSMYEIMVIWYDFTCDSIYSYTHTDSSAVKLELACVQTCECILVMMMVLDCLTSISQREEKPKIARFLLFILFFFLFVCIKKNVKWIKSILVSITMEIDENIKSSHRRTPAPSSKGQHWLYKR